MPVHDWTIVDAGIFHAFHHGWIWNIGDALNRGVLPAEYYALPEQQTGKYGPDVLTLERVGGLPGPGGGSGTSAPVAGPRGGGLALLTTPPRLKPTAEAEVSFYLRRQKSLVIRHVSDDRMVAVIEVVSPGNKSGTSAFRQFVEKAATLLLNDVHLMILDVFPPGPRDPNGVHAAVWEDVTGRSYEPPAGRPLATIAYEAFNGIRAFVQHLAVGDAVPDTPLFLAHDACVTPPLDAAYTAAFAAMPSRWREVLEPR